MSYSGRYFMSRSRATPVSTEMATPTGPELEGSDSAAEGGTSSPAWDPDFEWVETSDIEVDDSIELPEFKSSPPMNFLKQLHFPKKASPSSSVDDKEFVLLHSAAGGSDLANTQSERVKIDQRHRTHSSSSLSSQLESSMEIANSLESSSSPTHSPSASPSTSTHSSPVNSATVSAGRFLPKTTQYSSCPTKVCELELPKDGQPIDDKTFAKIPASALSYKSRKVLSLHMNPEQICGSDWKGLADYLGFDMLHILNFERDSDPMDKVLTQWIMQKDSTLGMLIENIKSLEREDVLTALEKLLKKDAQNWIKRQKEMENPVQVHEVSGTCYPYMPVCPELRGITLNDSPDGPIETFDAYVCHNPDTDYEFVLDMIQAMENPPYNLRFCTDWRDLVPGGSYATVTAELIENRCKRMIVVLSPEFLDSGYCDFQAKFALSLSPGARDKRMVPVMVTTCTPPSILRHITVCDYTKKPLRSFFWKRLYKALDLD